MKKSIFKKWWFWLIVVLVIGGIGSAIDKEEGTTTTNNTNTTEQTDTAKKEDTTKKEDTKVEEVKDSYAIGEEVKLKNNVLLVNNVVRSQGTDFDKPKDGKEYVIISVTLKNEGDKEESYNPYDFKIQNSQGNITDIVFTTVNSDTALSSGNLAPGGTVTGTLAFEAETGDKGIILKYNNNLFSSKEIKVKIDQ